ncbi:unnamed protein product [Blepharisma stoltei]|uniref:Uncharacterized protein n=1 Tax=Blepharisma stoltei TaxID=1481888 RepID=A0AAU9I4F9_9CILI|nr:unnamed protein product [Blepharisma stoltei]
MLETFLNEIIYVSGLIGISSFDPISCSISSNTLRITDFYEFLPGLMIINIPHVTPPSSAGIYDCVTEAYTQDSALNYIYYATDLSQDLTITPAGPPGSTSANP